MGPSVGSVAVGSAAVDTPLNLVCRVGSQRYALPIAHVVETMRPLPVTGVAGVPPTVLGLAVIRGAPTPVVDLAGLVGVTDAEPAGRFVLLNTGSRRVALAVTEVLGVHPIERAAFEALPPLLGDARALRSVAILDGELLAVIDRARLVSPSAWALLGVG